MKKKVRPKQSFSTAMWPRVRKYVSLCKDFSVMKKQKNEIKSSFLVLAEFRRKNNGLTMG
jgi:hypothetical protein